jgi:hypothetical protein
MILTIAIPILLVTYLTLGIIRCVFILSDVVQGRSAVGNSAQATEEMQASAAECPTSQPDVGSAALYVAT